MTCCSPRGKIDPLRLPPNPPLSMLPPTPRRAGDRAAVAELLQRAQAALARGSVRAAIDLLQQAIARDPSDVEPAFHLGNLFAVQGQTGRRLRPMSAPCKSRPSTRRSR